MILFDYPLNEKARNYLRFEFVFLEIKKYINLLSSADSTQYFKSLFDLIELTSRTDIRQDLVKDLRLQTEQLTFWLESEGIDKEVTLSLIDEIAILIDAVIAMPKVSRYFKENRFISSLKQRFSIPSGTCNFDLPHYHFWLENDLRKCHQDTQLWYSQFICIDEALTLFLKLKRSQSREISQIAKNGFYQADVSNASFITMKIDNKLNVYPMISGHKNRYSVRFMCVGPNNHLPKNIKFIEMFY
ncbi:MAG: cell division protein ZapD [Psychromonas sp.]|nr:cell division protein ZapD [Psychromonas sp.]